MRAGGGTAPALSSQRPSRQYPRARPAHARSPHAQGIWPGPRCRPRRLRAGSRSPRRTLAAERGTGKGHGLGACTAPPGQAPQPPCPARPPAGSPGPRSPAVRSDPRSRCRRRRPGGARRPHGQRVGAGRIRARGRRRGPTVPRPRAPRARATVLRAAGISGHGSAGTTHRPGAHVAPPRPRRPRGKADLGPVGEGCGGGGGRRVGVRESNWGAVRPQPRGPRRGARAARLT